MVNVQKLQKLFLFFSQIKYWLSRLEFTNHLSEKQLEDLKVLRRSPDLFNNVKIGQGQLQLIMKHILFYQPFLLSDLSNLMKNPSVISVKKMFR